MVNLEILSAGFLLTTGATDRNKTMNIYDVAGNCCEFTMEVRTLNDWKGRTHCGLSAAVPFGEQRSNYKELEGGIVDGRLEFIWWF